MSHPAPAAGSAARAAAPARDRASSPAPTADRPLVVFREEGCCVGFWRNVLMLRWDRPPSLQTLQKLGVVIGTVVRDYGAQGGGLVISIAPGCPLPRTEVAEENARLLKMYRDVLRCCAVVIPDAGAAGAFKRTLVSALQLASRATAPMEIFASEEVAARFVADKLGHEATEVARMLALLAQACATP